MVRVGDFATSGNNKLLFSIVSVALCAEEYFARGTTDCTAIMAGGAATWTVVEYMLHMSGTRVIRPMYVVGPLGTKIQLSRCTGVILQGMQEGGFVATAGLYFGDRLTDPKYFAGLHVLIVTIVATLFVKKRCVGAETERVASRRQVNAPGSVAAMSCATLFNAHALITDTDSVHRVIPMFCVMVYICAIWTLCAWFRGFRRVEVESYGTARPGTPANTLAVLGYDVVVEIGVAYTTFFFLFVNRAPA